MDSVKRSSITPSKGRLARTFAKVLHIRTATGVTPVDGIHKPKLGEKINRDHAKEVKDARAQLLLQEEEEKKKTKAATEAFVAKLFASVSSAKAAYAHLQFAQSPYDAEGIQFADQMVVAELKSLSELKQCYLKKHFDDSSPETTQLLAEIQEQNSLSKTYSIMAKKLDAQLKLKNSEITFLREKLAEATKENKLIERRLNASGQFTVLENLTVSSLTPSHFITTLRQATKSIRNFVRVMISEMESAGWDLDAAASSVEPGVKYWTSTHKGFTFESFVCREMFDGFNYQSFNMTEAVTDERKKKRIFFDRFMDLKSTKTKDYIISKPRSTFAKFCRFKYLKVIHPKMELSFFGNLDQRNLVSSGKYPETSFFDLFADVAKRVWLVHCLAFCFKPEASIFQMSKGSRFSEVFMESVADEAFLKSGETLPRVGFTVVPGFKIGRTVIQCQVYLR
jgi:hypothetical protein